MAATSASSSSIFITEPDIMPADPVDEIKLKKENEAKKWIEAYAGLLIANLFITEILRLIKTVAEQYTRYFPQFRSILFTKDIPTYTVMVTATMKPTHMCLLPKNMQKHKFEPVLCKVNLTIIRKYDVLDLVNVLHCAFEQIYKNTNPDKFLQLVYIKSVECRSVEQDEQAVGFTIWYVRSYIPSTVAIALIPGVDGTRL